jgi:protein-S-isoprenylcysteine O-methyltransferase Ste14
VNRSKVAAYATLGWVPHALAYVALPLGLARAAGGPDWAAHLEWPCLLGGPLVVAGAGFIAGAIVSHYRASPEAAQFAARPSYLATGGAYAVTRNPLYLGGGLMWAGWAIAFTSPFLAVVAALIFGFLAFVGVPYEERVLHTRLGAEYDAYAARVPRWFRMRRSGS